jgi:hypothetical protein
MKKTEKIAMEKSRAFSDNERLRKVGFPTFKSCVDYANLLNRLKEENEWLRKKTLKTE